MESAGALYGVGIIFLFLLGVLWFLLPFAIFGTQPKVQKILDEAKQANQLLLEIKVLLQSAGAHKCEACGKEFSAGVAVCPHCGCAR